MLITADGGYRRGTVFPLKPAADEACADAPTIEHVVVVKRGGNDVDMPRGPLCTGALALSAWPRPTSTMLGAHGAPYALVSTRRARPATATGR